MAQTFTKRTPMPVRSEELFEWHTRPEAFLRLKPFWEHVRLLEFEGIRDGQKAVLEVKAPFKRRWVAMHEGYIDGLQFRDRQVSGPFKRWEHTHRCEPDGDRSVMLDDITYEMPLGPLGLIADRVFGRDKIEQMFAHRHAVLLHDLQDHLEAGAVGPTPRRMTVAITGASGLVGSRLKGLLGSGGHVARGVQRASQGIGFNASAIAGADAVVHLAGEPIAQRWSQEVKREIHRSRVEGTRRLCATLAALPAPPKVLISGSAVGIYGSRGQSVLTEDSPVGEQDAGFLAQVARDWERATDEAYAAGIRLVHLRTSLVLSPEGGALKQMLPAFKAGAGGPIGGGKQWMPWIHIDDLCSLIYRAVWDDRLEGPLNAAAPEPVINRVFVKTLGRVLKRPAAVPLPAFAVRKLFGQMGEETLLASQRVVPQKLIDHGFRYRYPKLEDALRSLMGRYRDPAAVPLTA